MSSLPEHLSGAQPAADWRGVVGRRGTGAHVEVRTLAQGTPICRLREGCEEVGLSRTLAAAGVAAV